MSVPVVSSIIKNRNGRSALNSMAVSTLLFNESIVSADAILPFSFISMPIFCKTFDTCRRLASDPRASCGSDAGAVNNLRIPS